MKNLEFGISNWLTLDLKSISKNIFFDSSLYSFGLFIKNSKTQFKRSSFLPKSQKQFDINQLQEFLEEYFEKIEDFTSLLFDNVFYFRFKKNEANVEFLTNNINQVYIKGIYFQIVIVSICINSLKSFLLKDKSKLKEREVDLTKNESKLREYLLKSSWKLNKLENNFYIFENSDLSSN